jgi:16S rRNA (guanine966-N2)-methyltransferase
MRIVGGELKGRRLQAPADGRVRPTSDRIREALFNVLAHGDFGLFSLDNARILDLFAGTGALGLEALSRGGSFALFVDEDATSRGLIRTNAETLGVTGRTKIYRRDATKLGPRNASAGPAFDIAFADPPYGKGFGEKALAELLAGDWLAPHGLVVLEEDKSAELSVPEGFVELDRRSYATTQVLILKLKQPDD